MKMHYCIFLFIIAVLVLMPSGILAKGHTDEFHKDSPADLSASNTVGSRLQTEAIINAYGTFNNDDGSSYSMYMDFNSAGGTVEISCKNIIGGIGGPDPLTGQGVGYFEGGDGGTVSGSFSGKCVETLSEIIYYSSMTWEGHIRADGSGDGTFDAMIELYDSANSRAYYEPMQGYWSIVYDQGQPEPVPGPNLSDNQNPEPNPNLDTQDIEAVIEQINNLVSNPAVPITGAVAGTLLAALLAALRGALPTPVRNLPPAVRPAPQPGQVDANGRVYSPVVGGWVSPQMYDYQKQWSEKGWRWNAQTGRFEGQHGAVNENGQVMDDELGWVDQKTFQQNQQMRAEGMVYDRNLGWQTPEDLNRFESEREGIRQRGREFSAEKNAQIQRELKEAQAQRDREFQKIENARRADEIAADMEMYQKRAQRYIDRDKQLENYAYIAEKVEAAADAAIAVCARLTGPAGKTIAAAYEGIKEVALIADDVIAAEDKIGKAEELMIEKIKEEKGEEIKEKVEEKITSYVPSSVNRWMKKITKPIKKAVLRRFGKTGLILYQEVEKKVGEMVKEEAEEVVEEQIKTATDKVKDAIDPYLLTGG